MPERRAAMVAIAGDGQAAIAAASGHARAASGGGGDGGERERWQRGGHRHGQRPFPSGVWR